MEEEFLKTIRSDYKNKNTNRLVNFSCLRYNLNEQKKCITNEAGNVSKSRKKPAKAEVKTIYTGKKGKL